ncbi:hypothetical protein [Stenotrophomonas sepilia]|uniref:hypothetical protein n=1 Tax=Stenotrophomonas sepilia TaxID=2860290 RepID=UPI002E774879|nr:hypothetical protein [Stenotrophomonas sepilia]
MSAISGLPSQLLSTEFLAIPTFNATPARPSPEAPDNILAMTQAQRARQQCVSRRLASDGNSASHGSRINDAAIISRAAVWISHFPAHSGTALSERTQPIPEFFLYT